MLDQMLCVDASRQTIRRP